MGHVRLGRLPQTRKWRNVVDLLEASAPTDRIAAASADAAEASLRSAASDSALAHSVWLLTQLPIAARSADFAGQLSALGLRIGKPPTLLEVVSAFADAVDWQRTDGVAQTCEIAQQAAAESFTAIVGRSLPSLSRRP